DELEYTELFTPLYDTFDSASASEPTRVDDASTTTGDRDVTGAPSIDASVVDALVEARLAALRPALEEAAYARGHADGVRQGAEQAREPIGQLLSALTEAMSSVRAHEQRWLGNIEENLTALAVTVARHVIERELSTEPSVVTELVMRALRQFPLERQLTVRLHPDDHALIRQALAAGSITIEPTLEIHWLSDTHIVRGGCLVEGRERVLDGRLDTALERIYRTLGQVQA
nr:flagellar assembly protein FliH [Gemmatimonadaceae bacterium]